MDMLKETEWLTINKILLKMYNIHEIDTFANRILRICRMIIPYSKGYFIVFDDKGAIIENCSSFLEMEQKTYENYINSYYEKDYMKYIFDISNHSVTYRDTDIMEEAYRKKTEFYREFLRPNNIPYGAGIVLRCEGRNIGILNYFRNDMLGDFSDKDMFILDVLKEHLSYRLYRLMEQEKKSVQDRTLDLAKLAVFYGLSEREKEVMDHILEGKSNAEIGKLMIISLSTVKKHVYHIFSKVNVSTRTQLRAALEKKQKVL